MGVGADEDELTAASLDPDALADPSDHHPLGRSRRGIGPGRSPPSGSGPLSSPPSLNPSSPNASNRLGDVALEGTNDVVSRFVTFLVLIVIYRAGSEMPLAFFRLPSDAGAVAGNVFSEFVSSIVPAGAAEAAAAETAAALSSQSAAFWSISSDLALPRGVSLFHVGVGPFIAASIAMQVLVALTPSLKELTKDQVGQQTIKQYTRYLTFVVAVAQSVVTAAELAPFAVPGAVPVGGTFAYYAAVVPAFVAGALAVAWLADEMTNRGLGQGTSVMITMSVCGAYWSAAKYHWAAICSATWATAWPFVAAALALTAGSVLVQSGTCRVPLAYFQGPTVPGLPRVVREEVDHVPFKINPLGMQPVLVAVFLCEGACWLAKNAGAGEGVVNALRAALTASGGCPGLYYCVFFLIVFGFSYLDLQDTPKEVSEYLVKIGARIPDVRPGDATVAHLAAMQSGARFFGGASLGVVAVACAAADEWTRQTAGVCVGFTSMLIVTSTILQLKRQIVAMGQMPKLDQVIASV